MWTITSILPDPANYTLAIAYADGETLVADFLPLLDKGGVMAALRDPTVFGSARIGSRGRSVVWNDKVDFCADALRLKFGCRAA
ncbi:MAG: DUF2442 domain-containing protein [Sulfuricellaceae bacterium]